MGGRLPLSVEQYLKNIEDNLLAFRPPAKKELFQAVVNAPFYDELKVTQFDLGMTVLLLINKNSDTIDRVALSETKMAKSAEEMSVKSFKSIRIPLNNQQNIINKAIVSGKTQETANWYDLFVPELTPRQAASNQSGAGVECSVVCKLNVKDGGAMVFSFYQPLGNLKETHYAFVHSYSQLAENKLNNHLQLF